MKGFRTAGTRRAPGRTAAIFAAAILLACCAAANDASCQPGPTDAEVIVTFGDSRIYTDLTSAKNAAVSEALLFAVQSAASGITAKAELTENFERIAALLDRRRDTFIVNYRILREYQSEDIYRVLLEATVSKRAIRQALEQAGIRIAPARLPSVLLMIAEKNIDDLGFNYWWQRRYASFSNQVAPPVIRQTFEQRGFTVVSPDAAQSGPQDSFSVFELDAEPPDYQASIIANRLGAELVVVGKAEAEATANQMGENVRTFKAVVNLHVIRAATGERLTTIHKQAMAVARNPARGSKNALADAAYQAGRQLTERIAALWQNMAQAADQFTIRVRGEAILPHLEQLRAALESQPDVSGLQTTEMTPDTATLAVDYKGTTQELANHLLLQSFDGFGINISEISEKRLTVELVSR